MALFVAKLLETQKPLVSARSPYESFETKLAQSVNSPKPYSALDKTHIAEVLSDWVQNHSQTSQSINELHCSSRWSNAISILEEIESDPVEFHSDPKSVLEMLESNIRILERRKTAEVFRMQEQARQDELRKEKVLRKSQNFLSKACDLLSKLENIGQDAEEMEKMIANNLEFIAKAKFLESSVNCIEITDAIRNIPIQEHLDKAIDIIESLKKVDCLRQSLRGRTQQVIDNRYNILLNSFIESLITGASRAGDYPEDLIRIYNFLEAFNNTNPDIALEIALKNDLNKFDYHFIRKSSALNLADKPEWPLRWFMDTALQWSDRFTNPEQGKKVSRFLAKKARQYFNSYRWAVIKRPRSEDERDLFSLNLARYLHAANQWKESFGSLALNEFIADLKSTTKLNGCDWNLLEEWISHDRAHIQYALDGVKSPFKPSIHNPLLCNSVQTMIDVFTSSEARLESVSKESSIISAFYKSCHDEALDEFIFNTRKRLREIEEASEKRLLKESLISLISFLDASMIGSGSIRKQLSDIVRSY